MSPEELNNFRSKLLETTTFPTVYMFKFIVKSENRLIALVETLFDEDAEIHIKESSSGKYTSITAKQVVVDVDSITNVYQKANEIPGIIFL
jgi:putative lipoic acid-binding regulatory protein